MNKCKLIKKKKQIKRLCFDSVEILKKRNKKKQHKKQNKLFLTQPIFLITWQLPVRSNSK